ncbi:MAG: element excision factor XisI family protein [Elainellaceae cyanobacterium]
MQELLLPYSAIKANKEQVEAEAIFDKNRDHYQIAHVGWSNDRRIYGCILHIDIIGDKIWIQHDGTRRRYRA